MKFNPLGDTDIMVSQIALGTMNFGEQNTKAEGQQQLDYAIENGINLIDTAELYAIPSTEENNGKTEEIIGSWLKNKQIRDKLILATKITGPREGLEYVSETLDYSPKRINEALEGSLKRLNTDYIDLYQLHWPERNTNFFGKRGFQHYDDEEWLYNFHTIIETMDNLKKAGKIRHWGISNETPWGVMKYLLESDLSWKARPVSIQNPYNLLNRTYEIGLAEISVRERIGLLAYSPLAFGRLSGKYLDGKDTSFSRINQFESMNRYNSSQSIEATKRYNEIAQKYDISLAQMSLSYIRSKSFTTSTIIGATNMTQLIENINSINMNLSDELIEEINSVHEHIPNPAP